MNYLYKVSTLTITPVGEWLDWDSGAYNCQTYDDALRLMMNHCTWDDVLFEKGDTDANNGFLAHAVWMDEEGFEYDFRLFRREYDS